MATPTCSASGLVPIWIRTVAEVLPPKISGNSRKSLEFPPKTKIYTRLPGKTPGPASGIKTRSEEIYAPRGRPFQPACS